MRSKKYAAVDENRCVACGACVHECPRQAIRDIRKSYAMKNKDTIVSIIIKVLNIAAIVYGFLFITEGMRTFT